MEDIFLDSLEKEKISLMIYFLMFLVLIILKRLDIALIIKMVR